MENLVRAADALQKLCQQNDWKFAFIGGLTLQYWGRPRLTQDVDLCLLTGFGDEAAFIDRLLAEYQSRIADARQFALNHRILLLATRDGISLDISLGGINRPVTGCTWIANSLSFAS